MRESEEKFEFMASWEKMEGQPTLNLSHTLVKTLLT